MRACKIVAISWIGLVAAVLPVAAQDQHLFGQQPVLRDKTLESEIRIEEIPATVVMIRDFRGHYKEHVRVFTDLIEYARRYVRLPRVAPPELGNLVAGSCVGIYPMDPDTVINPANLRFQAAIYLEKELVGNGNGNGQPRPEAIPERLPTRRPAAPYRLTRLPATKAAVLKSDVMHSEFDGMSMYRWMLENGYVQTAPTRMESLTPGHTSDPRQIPVRIVIPVTERKSGVKLPAAR